MSLRQRIRKLEAKLGGENVYSRMTDEELDAAIEAFEADEEFQSWLASDHPDNADLHAQIVAIRRELGYGMPDLNRP